MKTYKVILSRAFNVTIEAENASDAGHLADFFLGYHDEASELDKSKNMFSITSVDMIENDIIEVKDF
jgi:hypothetical protein